MLLLYAKNNCKTVKARGYQLGLKMNSITLWFKRSLLGLLKVLLNSQ